jgi:hypothetical protein
LLHLGAGESIKRAERFVELSMAVEESTKAAE